MYGVRRLPDLRPEKPDSLKPDSLESGIGERLANGNKPEAWLRLGLIGCSRTWSGGRVFRF